MAAAASPAAAQTTSSDVANMRKQIAQLMMAQNYAGYQGRISGPNGMYQGGSWSGGRAGGGGVGGYGPGNS